MKIEWLNSDLTEARVTRGFLWWKRVAHVKREGSDPTYSQPWTYVPSGHTCVIGLEGRRDEELYQRRVDSDWLPVSSLPAAKVVRR